MANDTWVENLIDNLFAVMVARAPRRPSPSPRPKHRPELPPDCKRVTLEFKRMRQRWRNGGPVPNNTNEFAQVLQLHGVYVFDVSPGFVECADMQRKIAKALGS